jgi:hypothetical protein
LSIRRGTRPPLLEQSAELVTRLLVDERLSPRSRRSRCNEREEADLRALIGISARINSRCGSRKVSIEPLGRSDDALTIDNIVVKS